MCLYKFVQIVFFTLLITSAFPKITFAAPSGNTPVSAYNCNCTCECNPPNNAAIIITSCQNSTPQVEPGVYLCPALERGVGNSNYPGTQIPENRLCLPQSTAMCVNLNRPWITYSFSVLMNCAEKTVAAPFYRCIEGNDVKNSNAASYD